MMVRVNGVNWTADFTISRALAEAYSASGKEEISYFCVGDPDKPIDRLGPGVGTELLKYYPHVVGTIDQPIRDTDLLAAWERASQERPNAFMIGIEAAEGPAESEGFIEVSGRGIRRRPQALHAPPWMCDVAITAFLWTGEPPAGLTALQFNRIQRITDAIIDGQIRFLQKAKKYLPDL